MVRQTQALADSEGYASDMKAYKQDPAAFKGSVADIAMMLRVAVTGKQVSPDTYCVMKILGKERVLGRISTAAAEL